MNNLGEDDRRSQGAWREGQSLVLGSLGRRGAANVMVPPWQMVRGPLALPPGLLGRESRQPSTKHKANDWTVPLVTPRADKTLRGAALTCLKRRRIMSTRWFLWTLRSGIMADTVAF